VLQQRTASAVRSRFQSPSPISAWRLTACTICKRMSAS
jgi:hypothetical protein